MFDRIETSKEWMEENSKKPGVISLPSGLQYRVLRQGEGKDHPAADTPCEAHVEGRAFEQYPSGRIFESTHITGDRQPRTFVPNKMLPGLTEGMQLMVEGDLWEFFLSVDLGHGEAGGKGSLGKIPPGSATILKLELVKIECQPETLAHCSEGEREYIHEMRSRGPDAMQEEFGQLHEAVQAERSRMAEESPYKVDARPPSAEALWAIRRVKILERITPVKAEL